MKKLFYSLMIMLFAGVLSVSCDNSSSGGENDIGTGDGTLWSSKVGTYTGTTLMYEDDPASSVLVTFKLVTDGTATLDVGGMVIDITLTQDQMASPQNIPFSKTFPKEEDAMADMVATGKIKSTGADTISIDYLMKANLTQAEIEEFLATAPSGTPQSEIDEVRASLENGDSGSINLTKTKA